MTQVGGDIRHGSRPAGRSLLCPRSLMTLIRIMDLVTSYNELMLYSAAVPNRAILGFEKAWWVRHASGVMGDTYGAGVTMSDKMILTWYLSSQSFSVPDRQFTASRGPLVE